MGTNDTSTQQPDIISTLLNAGQSQQTQQNTGNMLQGLLSLLQPTPSPQSANASLGQGTTNVLNNAAQFTGNPAVASGNYDATQNTGINQQQLAQTLQRLGQSGAGISNQPQQGLGGVQTLNQTNPTTGLNDNHAKILQGLIDKGTKQHAQQFLNTYGPQTAQQLVDAHNATSPNNAQAQGQAQPTAQAQPTPALAQPAAPAPSQVSNPGDKIQEQAMNIAMQKPGILGSLFKGMFEANQSAQLNVLKQAQEITQGGPPLSPADKATAIGSWNSALLKQHQDFQSDLSEQMKANVDAQTAFIKNTPLPSKAADWPAYTAQLQQYSTNAYQISSKMQEGYNKYKGMALTNPVTGKKSSSSQYSGITPDMARQELTNRIKNKRGNQ